MKKMAFFLLVLSLLLLPLEGCGSRGEPGTPADPPVSRPSANASSSSNQRPGGTSSSSAADPPASSAAQEEPFYHPPKVSAAEFHAQLAQGEPGAQIDISAVSEGYVAASGSSDHRLKFQVIRGDSTYNYDLPNNGTPCIFSLQSGDGTYQFRIMENISESKYVPLFSTEADVKLKDEFQPFLRTCQYADYRADSACVRKAAELVGKTHSALEASQAVISYICDTVTYDKEKAATVPKGYIPVPDETFSTGKGICFDYASLAACMLRSQGIPTKIIFGYVASGGEDLYHAWNMIYAEESGWILVEYQVRGGDWNRMDCTFAANGGGIETIGDGSKYADLYVY